MATPSKRITTDPAAIDELLTRGVAEVYPSADALRVALASGRRLRVYNGIDPTAPTLHIGHLAVLQKLRQFQNLGHEVIMLIGDATGMIGDPTDKSAARQPLTRKQVTENAKHYKAQASAVLSFTGNHTAQIRRNSEWWDTMSAMDAFALLGHTTAQRLLERDMFAKRMKEGKPVSDLELQYPVMQGYDSVAMDIDVEVGGTDQTFNMLMGREYVKKIQDREKFVITVPLLADASGKKIGKTEGNMVELGAKPDNLYGQAMALPDGVVIACFTQCTAIPMDDVHHIEQELKGGANPRDAKMRLAHEFVRMRYGDKKADIAQQAFVQTFQKHEAPEGVLVVKISASGGKKYTLAELLVEAGLASSKSEARRLVEQKGVKVDGAVTEDAQSVMIIPANGFLIQKGKRHFVRVVRT